MSEPTIHICFSHFDEQIVEVQDCPTCKSPQQFFAQHQDWYGWTKTCLNCGDQWVDGQLCQRPFMPKWRENNIAYYRSEAEKLGLLPKEEEKEVKP